MTFMWINFKTIKSQTTVAMENKKVNRQTSEPISVSFPSHVKWYLNFPEKGSSESFFT